MNETREIEAALRTVAARYDAGRSDEDLIPVRNADLGNACAVLMNYEMACEVDPGCSADGSAPALGAGGRQFDSGHPDHIIPFYQHDWIPGFAAFASPESSDAKPFIVLNLGACLGAVECGDIEKGELPYMIAESLMHEIVHALEHWAGVEFSEERVEGLLKRYREASPGGINAQR